MQIPAAVFNDNKRDNNFGPISRREVLTWLKRNGIKSGQIFDGSETNHHQRLARIAKSLRNLQLESPNALITKAIGLVERAAAHEKEREDNQGVEAGP